MCFEILCVKIRQTEILTLLRCSQDFYGVVGTWKASLYIQHCFHLHSEIDLLFQNVIESSPVHVRSAASLTRNRGEITSCRYFRHTSLSSVLDGTRKRRNYFRCCFRCVLSGLQRRHLERDGFGFSAAVSKCQHIVNLF